MSRLDQAISTLRQGRPALLIDDYRPDFLGYVIFPCLNPTTDAIQAVEAISNNQAVMISKRSGGVISYSGPNEAAQELLDTDYMLISSCNNEAKQTASEKELRNLSTTQSIPPLFLTDVVRWRFQKEIDLNVIKQEVFNEFEFIQYINPYNNCIHSVFIKGQINQEALLDFEPINLLIEQNTKKMSETDLFASDKIISTLLDNYSRGIFLHIYQPETIINEENRIFFIPAKILTRLGVKRVKITSQSKSTFQGIAALGIEVTQGEMI